MKQALIFLLTIISFNNCINHNYKEQNMLNNKIEILKNNNFEFPKNSLFKERLKLVFGLNVDSISSNEFYLEIKPIIPDAPEFYPTVYKKEKYLDADNFTNDLSFVSFNKYIFYEDRTAFNYLKLNDNYYLYMLVQDYGYYNNELLEYIFENINKDLESPFAYAVFFGRTGIYGNWELRKKIFQKYVNQYPDANISVIYFIAPILEEKNPYEGNREYDVAFILNLLIERNQKNNIYPVGEADYIFTKYPNFLKHLKDNNYYSFSQLKSYSENKSNLDNNDISIIYYIQDPDGYANLRKEKSKNSEIIQQLKNGEKIEVINNEKNWIQIKTKEGKEGYVYYDRVKMK